MENNDVLKRKDEKDQMGPNGPGDVICLIGPQKTWKNWTSNFNLHFISHNKPLYIWFIVASPKVKTLPSEVFGHTTQLLMNTFTTLIPKKLGIVWNINSTECDFFIWFISCSFSTILSRLMVYWLKMHAIKQWSLSQLRSIFGSAVHRKAKQISADISHTVCSKFELLTSGHWFSIPNANGTYIRSLLFHTEWLHQGQLATASGLFI